MMRKFILAVLVVWCAIYLFKRTVRKNKPPAMKEDIQKDEQMVQCACCHLHIPRSEAYLVEQQFYCSKQHIPNA